MFSSSSSASLHWPTTTSLRRLSQSPVDAHAPEIALAWAPIYVFQSCQHAFKDTRQYWPSIRHRLVHHNTTQSRGQQYPSSRSGLVLVSNACPHCWRRPKLPDHRFCSVACGQSAARLAPGLKCLPPNHELFVQVATQFMKRWGSVSCPKVLAVYMITWTESYQRGFEQYRDAVEARGQFKRMGRFPGNEQKRFRSTDRACTLGERGNIYPCHDETCWMCETIRCGFEPHLRRKRSIPWNGAGIRLGAGIYTSQTSSKADHYAVNVHNPNSNVKAMLVCRVVIGKEYVAYQENQAIRSPPPGYDCVFGKPGWRSDFVEDEYVVYDADAIRPAYLVMYENMGGT